MGAGLMSAFRSWQAAVDQRFQAGLVQRDALAVVGHVQAGLGRGGGRSVFGGLFLGGGALLVAAFAVQHIGTGHVLVAAAHQGQLDVVLHVLDVEGAALGARAQQRAHDAVGQRFDGFTDADRGGALGAAHGQEGLGQGDGNLLRRERHDVAAAANDLVLVQDRRNAAGPGVGGAVRGKVGVGAVHSVLA